MSISAVEAEANSEVKLAHEDPVVESNKDTAMVEEEMVKSSNINGDSADVTDGVNSENYKSVFLDPTVKSDMTHSTSAENSDGSDVNENAANYEDKMASTDIESADHSSTNTDKDVNPNTEKKKIYDPEPYCIGLGKPDMIRQDCPSAYYDLTCDFPDPPDENIVNFNKTLFLNRHLEVEVTSASLYSLAHHKAFSIYTKNYFEKTLLVPNHFANYLQNSHNCRPI